MAKNDFLFPDGSILKIYSVNNAFLGTIKMSNSSLELSGDADDIAIAENNDLIFLGLSHTLKGGSSPTTLSFGTSGDVINLNVTGVTYNVSSMVGNLGLTGNLAVTGALDVNITGSSGDIAYFGVNSTQERLKISADTSNTNILAQNGNNLSLGTSGSGTAIKILNSNNYVGIGLETPTAKFEVYNASQMFFGCENASLRFTSTADTFWIQGTNVAKNAIINYINFSGYSGNNFVMRVDILNQRLGIGTDTPDRKLEVLDASNPQLRLSYSDNSVYTDFRVTSSGYLYINPTGNNVGIGTDTPGARLDVNGNIQLSGHLLPSLTDTYDIGSSVKWFRSQYVSSINATVFTEMTQSLLGGWLTIGKDQGSLPAVSSVQTTIDFGKSMTVGHFIVVKAHDSSGVIKTEYMQIGSLVSGTTYNVTRDLASAHGTDPAWTDGTPYLLLGTAGSGRIELNAYDTPRLSIIIQGSSYNSQTEIIRLGDVNGLGGYSGEQYGFVIGDSTNYFKYSYTANALETSGIIKALSGDFVGYMTVNNGTMKIGKDAGGSGNHGIYITDNNYWYSTGNFKVGGVSQYILWNGTTLSIAGSISVIGGEVSIGTSPNWFRVDVNGNLWSGAVDLATAQTSKFAVTNSGTMYAITGYLGGSTNGWQISSGTIVALGTGIIKTSSSTTRNEIDSSGIRGYNSGTQRFNLGIDGSGWLGASNIISWTNAGVVNIAGWSVDSSKIYLTNTYISSSGYISFGNTPPTSYGNNVGVWIGYSSGAKLSLYADTSNYFQWDATKLLIKAANFTLDSSGNITASNVTLTGAINATSGYIGSSSNGWNIGSTGITANGTGRITIGTLLLGNDVYSSYDGIYNNGDYWYDSKAFQFGGGTGITYAGSGAVSIGTNVNIYGTLSIGILPNLPNDSDLTVFWNLNGNARAQLGTAVHGSVGSAVTFAQGVTGLSAVFPNSTSSTGYITAETVYNLGAMTISFWTKSTDSTVNTVFRHGNGANYGAFHFNWSSSRPLLYLNSANYRYWDATSAQNDGNWHHWAIVITGALASSITSAELWLDGVKQNVQSTSSKDTPLAFSYLQLGYGFSGSISEYKVYNRVLTAVEIQALYLYPQGALATTIVGDQIKTGTIYSNNWSSSTGGCFNLDSEYIKMGGSNASYNNSGVFIGKDGSTYTFSVANSSTTQRLAWSGSVLSVYNASNALIFNVSGSACTLAGWTATASTLANGTDIVLDATNKYLSVANGAMKFGYNISSSNSGIYIDANNYWFSGGSWKVYGDASNYLERTGTTLKVYSSNFVMVGSTTLYIDTSKISVGASASANTVASASAGTVFDNAGLFKTYLDANNYIRRDGSSLDIKSTIFTLQASTSGSIGLTATSFSVGNGVWLSSTATTRFRVGNASASRLQWDDTNLEFYNSSNVKIVSIGTTNTIAGWTFDNTSLTTTNARLRSTGILSLGSGDGYQTANSIYIDGANSRISVGANFYYASDTLYVNRITATSGTIGSFTISSTTIYATNLTLTSGAANTANITVGTGSTAGGLNSANASGDITFWSGETFTNRATAPFRVTAGGSLTSTNATITGTITANTGYLGGTTNGWQISAGNITAIGTGRLTIGAMLLGNGVNSTSDGIYLDANNYWFTDGTFKTYYDSNNYLLRASSYLEIKSTSFQLLTSGSMGLGATSYSVGNGVWISSTASNRFRVGNASASRMQWTDTNLEFYNSSNSKLVSLGATNTISGWNLTTTALYSGNIYLDTSGYIRHNSDYWRLNNDGSGQLANGNISWNSSGTLVLKYRGRNLLNDICDFNWYVGMTMPPTGFNMYSNASANTMVLDLNPFNTYSVLWKAYGHKGTGGVEGGFSSTVLNINPNKSYMFVIYVKRSSLDGISYFGCKGRDSGGSDIGVVVCSSGAVSTNPYFASGRDYPINTWYMLVGYIFHKDYVYASQNYGAAYDITTGIKYEELTDFKWQSNNAITQMRAFFYNNPTEGSYQYFYAPAIYELDGSEPSLADLLGFNITTLGNYLISSPTIRVGTYGVDYLQLDSSGIRGYKTNTQRFNLSVDGSGWMGASNKFSWDNAGTVNISGWTINASSISKVYDTDKTLYIDSNNYSMYLFDSTPASGEVKFLGIGRLHDGSAWGTENGIGMVVYNGSTYDKYFWLGQTIKTIAGWTFNATTFYNGTDIVLDANNKRISVANGAMKFGYNVSSTYSGLYIDANNYWFSNSDIKVYGDTNNYILKSGSSLTINSQNFLLQGSTTLYLSTSKLALGASASSLTVSDNNAGTIIDNAGNFKSYYDASNYIRKSGTTLEIKTTSFQLLTSGSIGLGATSYVLGNGVWISSTATNMFRVGNASASRLQWDDTNLEFYNSSNTKIASFGASNSIAGWDITTDSITKTLNGSTLVLLVSGTYPAIELYRSDGTRNHYSGVGRIVRNGSFVDAFGLYYGLADETTNRFEMSLDSSNNFLTKIGGWLFNAEQFYDSASKVILNSANSYISVGTGTNAYKTANRIFLDGANSKFSVGTGMFYESDSLSVGGWTFDTTKMIKNSGSVGIEISTYSGNTLTSGFILYDPSNPKFFIGNTTASLDWNITTANALSIKGGSFSTSASGQRIVIDSGNAIKFYDSGGTLMSVTGELTGVYHFIKFDNASYLMMNGGTATGQNGYYASDSIRIGVHIGTSVLGNVFEAVYNSTYDSIALGWGINSNTANVHLFNYASGALGTDGDFYLTDTSKKLYFGTDVNLYRYAADILKTDDNFLMMGELYFSNTGSKLGYSPNPTGTSFTYLYSSPSDKTNSELDFRGKGNGAYHFGYGSGSGALIYWGGGTGIIFSANNDGTIYNDLIVRPYLTLTTTTANKDFYININMKKYSDQFGNYKRGLILFWFSTYDPGSNDAIQPTLPASGCTYTCTNGVLMLPVTSQGSNFTANAQLYAGATDTDGLLKIRIVTTNTGSTATRYFCCSIDGKIFSMSFSIYTATS